MNNTAKILISILIVALAGLVGLIFFMQVNFDNDLEDVKSQNDFLQAEINTVNSEKSTLKRTFTNQQNKEQELFVVQENLVDEINNYLEVIDETIEVSRSGVNVLPEVDIVRLESTRNQLELELITLEDELVDIKRSSQENATIVNNIN